MRVCVCVCAGRNSAPRRALTLQRKCTFRTSTVWVPYVSCTSGSCPILCSHMSYTANSLWVHSNPMYSGAAVKNKIMWSMLWRLKVGVNMSIFYLQKNEVRYTYRNIYQREALRLQGLDVKETLEQRGRKRNICIPWQSHILCCLSLKTPRSDKKKTRTHNQTGTWQQVFLEEASRMCTFTGRLRARCCVQIWVKHLKRSRLF